MKNFHLPLPAAFHAELTAAASELGQPATKLALELVRRGLDDLARARRRRQISTYAEATASSSDDYDALLETAALEAIEPRRAAKKSRRATR